MLDYTVLKEMCRIHAPSGNESAMTQYLLDHIEAQKKHWKVQPQRLSGNDLQDCIVLVFGKPRTAIFAHIDSVGFSVRYHHQLIRIGGPQVKDGIKLCGADSQGPVNCTLVNNSAGHEYDEPSYEFNRIIDRGTTLTFLPEWVEDDNYIQCCYLDNRLGVFSALQVAQTLENGIICFSCWEETGGGSVEFLAKMIYEQYGVRQALISDITWATEGVIHGSGCAISMRDSGIPRKSYVDKIISLVAESRIPFQLEVEASGGSDGNILHRSPYPIDWCFIGAPESNVHSPQERVNKNDVVSMIQIYNMLMAKM